MNGFDFRRLRRWEWALAVFALSTPFLLPALAPGPASLISPAMAETVEKPDTSRVVSIGGAVTEITASTRFRAKASARSLSAISTNATWCGGSGASGSAVTSVNP